MFFRLRKWLSRRLERAASRAQDRCYRLREWADAVAPRRPAVDRIAFGPGFSALALETIKKIQEDQAAAHADSQWHDLFARTGAQVGQSLRISLPNDYTMEQEPPCTPPPSTT